MMQNRRRFTLFFVVITAVIIPLWLYWPTIRLPLIYDTLLHIRITGTLDFGSVWLPAKEFNFYRPLTFFPMLVIESLFGYYPNWLLHGINVIQHAANAGLLAWLSWRLWGNGRFALAAGLLFALFPFSYQAVVVYGHNVHPTTVGLILLGLHSYLMALDGEGKRPFWWTLTAFWFVLGLLSHESAVLFGGFAALVQWNREKNLPKIAIGSLHLRQSPWFIFLVLGALYLIGYQFLPILESPDAGSINLNSLNLRFLYLLQGAIYPLAWLGKWLGIDSAPPIIWVGTAVITLWALISLRNKQNRLPLLLGAGWWIAAYALIAIPLSTSYLLHGPRLLYVGSVGVALFWAALLETIIPEKQNQLKHLGWLILLFFALLTSGIFVRHQIQTYKQLTEPVDTIKTTMANVPDGSGIVTINLPEFISPQPTTYPVGVEIVSMLGHYLFVGELVDANLSGTHPATAIVSPEQLTQTTYNFAVHNQHTWDDVDFSLREQHVFLTTFADDGITTEHKGWVGRNTAVSTPIVDFTQYKLLTATANTCNSQTNLELTWAFHSTQVEPTTTIFVQLFDNNGQLIGQADGPPLAVRPDLIPAQKDAIMIDMRMLTTDNQQPTTALIGAYNYLNGERFPASDSEGNVLPNNAWKIDVTPCS
jgi:hypothetical protein